MRLSNRIDNYFSASIERSMASPGSPPDRSPNPLESSSEAPFNQPESLEQPVSIPLREQIKRGWDWVVFVWQMLRRVGGPLDLLLAFWTMISVLVGRLLTQLGILRK